MWLGLMRVREDHMTQTDVEPIYYCKISAPEPWVLNSTP